MANSWQRLAIFIPSLNGGGAQRLILKLANGFVERGYCVDLVLAQATGPYLPEVPETVRIVDLKASRTLFCLPALVGYLRQNRPIALLSALDYANLIALWASGLARVSTPVVVSEHNTLSLALEHARGWHKRLLPTLMRWFYPQARTIVTVSQGVAEDLPRVTGLDGDRICTIYNPVITPDLREKAKAPLEHPWLKPGEPPVVLAVGRLVPQKDFSTLIRAFAQLRQHRAARLIVLGEGVQRPELEGLVRQFGLESDVSLPGFVLNPYPYMARASVFVLSSRWEGLGIVAIEAMYLGTPVVSTDCPHGPREILQDGKYGTLVPVGDEDRLAKAIEMAMTQEAVPPCQESWQPFEVDTVVNQYLHALVG
ncbi:MAG TPA: glycosyltransferase [Oscillatoriales cyanobacterium M59_W2019_021]|nr:MAG: glycosyltransferase [Cyanobacteria bacterium J055]HIK30747.1 glycosyltransferase [Oscillatoriales cyanobacterium M4454_W2019_049]HIK51932.1 glycosyltransferase [Oscillatoriales cyanobacterium M59_W2019_021]